MALWTVTENDDQSLYTVVYLLKDALHSALGDALFLEEATCPKAEVKGASHTELSARLSRFRDRCNGLKEREALMLTKLMRVRQWTEELRRLAPEISDDADQFIEATSGCYRFQGDFVNDAERMFNGGLSLNRFLARRQPGDDEVSAKAVVHGDYRVGGETLVFELRVACEVFLDQIDAEFFPQTTGDTAAPTPSFLSYLDAAVEERVTAQVT